MYTEYGRQQRNKLTMASEVGKDLLALLRPIVATVPKTVIDRTKASGVGGNKERYSAYSGFWAAKRRQAGLQTGNKDFLFSGTMWDSYQIVDEEVTANGVSYTLGTTAGKGSNGQFLSDIHSSSRTKHSKGGTQGESQLILDLTDEEYKKLEDEMWEVINKTLDVLIK